MITLFLQVRQGYRESANLLLKDDPDNLKVKLTVQSIWIDALIEEEIILSGLRRTDGKMQKYTE